VIRVILDDLAFVRADAIVRPATTRLEPTSASLRNLEQVGGPAFWTALQVSEELGVGSAVVTGSGELASGLVIHAIIAGPTEPVTADTVRRALHSVLQRAEDWHLHHLALPPIGTGPGNLGVEDVARIFAKILRVTHTTAAHPQDVTIVVDSEQDRTIFETHLKTVQLDQQS
jgi:O-acetyl-ADP-ribose deacetylase (regulator of RNase III)